MKQALPPLSLGRTSLPADAFERFDHRFNDGSDIGSRLAYRWSAHFTAALSNSDDTAAG